MRQLGEEGFLGKGGGVPEREPGLKLGVCLVQCLGGKGKGAFPVSVATFSVALVLSDPEQREYWVTGLAFFNHSG